MKLITDRPMYTGLCIKEITIGYMYMPLGQRAK